MRASIIFVLICLILLTSCNKNKGVDLDMVPIEISEYPLEEVYVKNDSVMFACGGIRFNSGILLSTTNGGNDWGPQTIFYNNKKVFDVYFVNDNLGFAGTEDVFIYKTVDGGNSWQAQWNTPTAYHEVHRPIVREIEFYNDSIGYFVGGENYQTGVIYLTEDAGDTWVLDTLLHGLRSIEVISDGSALVCGHGYIGKSTGVSLRLNQLDHPDGIFVSIKKLNDTDFLVLDQNGGLLKFTNGGSEWDYLIKPNGLLSKRKYFCDIASVGNTYLISGDDGLLWLSYDAGSTWQFADKAGDYKYNKITTFRGDFYVAREDGSLVVIKP